MVSGARTAPLRGLRGARALVVALALAVGLAMPATAAAVDVVGRSVLFYWPPAAGPLIGYRIFVTRNGGPEVNVMSTVAQQTWATIYGEYGDQVRVRVMAFDNQLNAGPPSELSSSVRFVEEAPAEPPVGGDPDPTPVPDPEPTPDPDPEPAPEPTPEQSTAALDFDGDGRSDLVIRDYDTGETRVITMDGASPDGALSLATHPPQHALVANGDYNGDGFADAVWLDPGANELLVELTDPAASTPGAPLDAAVLSLPDRSLVGGSADFDGDGRSDLVVVDLDAPQMMVWVMDGVSVDQVLLLGDPRGNRLIASGDFDGDGRLEILTWSTTFRRQRRHQIEGGAVVSTETYRENIGASWVPVGVGDYDGDAIDDVLWLDRDTGVLEAWCLAQPGTVIREVVDLALPPGAEVTGSGDYDGDGRMEIVVREQSPGGLSMWFMDGPAVLEVVPVAPLSASWGLVGVGGEAPTP